MYPVLLRQHHPPPHSTSVKVFHTFIEIFASVATTAAAPATARSQPHDRQAGEGIDA